jgi:multimeric flavodoxin WrbA
MITIISDDANQKIGTQIYEMLCNQNKQVEYISISDSDVRPCYNCGGCTYKTYGKCIVRDDGDNIYPMLIQANTWVIVTPLLWGSYSFQTKRVLDKIALIGDRHYQVNKKELVKKMQGNLKNYFAIGVKNECSLKEKEVFTNLVSENVNIMSVSGSAFVVNMELNKNDIRSIAKEVSR